MSAQLVPSGLDFVNVMNETWVTFVRDLSGYGWGRDGSGWEACSPDGEICLFETEREARAWRAKECRLHLGRLIKLRMNAAYGHPRGYEGGVTYFAGRLASASLVVANVFDVNSLYPAEVVR